jgi:hypothetical protein
MGCVRVALKIWDATSIDMSRSPRWTAGMRLFNSIPVTIVPVVFAVTDPAAAQSWQEYKLLRRFLRHLARHQVPFLDLAFLAADPWNTVLMALYSQLMPAAVRICAPYQPAPGWIVNNAYFSYHY